MRDLSLLPVALGLAFGLVACSTTERPFNEGSGGNGGDSSGNAGGPGSGGGGSKAEGSGGGGPQDPCPVNDPAPGCSVVQIAVSIHNSCALVSDGTVRCWGANDFGQLGIGTFDSDAHDKPVKVDGLSDITKISLGGDFACALRSDHHLFCWGRNALGQLGNGTDEDSSSPKEVPLNNVQDVAAALTTTCVIRTGGAVYCWGENATGALGINDTTYPPDTCMGTFPEDCHLEPKAVSGLNGGVAAIAGGLSSHFARLGGQIFYWGLYLLGDASAPSGSCDFPCTDSPTPIDVDGKSVQLVATSSYSFACAVADDRTYCAGDNTSGQLGLGDTTPSSSATFVQTSGQLATKSLAVGSSHACLVTAGGELYCWGANAQKQLGLGAAVAMASAPTHVAPLGAVSQVAAASRHTCALLKSGEVDCWGQGAQGILGIGDGDLSERPSPTKVLLP